MKNRMKEVAKMFGVEINEEFEIIFPDTSTCYATAMFTNDGVKVIDTNVCDVYNLKAYILTHLLNGNYGIKRKPWKPFMYEIYYFTDGHHVISTDWKNYVCDWNSFKIGNCYKTQEEAERDKDKWAALYSSDNVLTI